ncbi:MAG: hypothetical protein US31_C0012G0007 [Berkelbacteria bacterium GW2011_GWA1_36_9]|uniref:Uncharacterized protein n=1 Tax=Berkelbacteria bacterium GW2011_GWA1_36_9 TaxID=1618331 RepID=A0A0G0IPL2_9BACT|nr:MAG: hypothetical protein US31_C0012G0007 [Berkelbacteria bacterium GW2011_GWA1_36_9]
MKKNQQIIAGTATLIIGVLLLGADRLFASASTTTYSQSVTVLTTVSIVFLLIGTVVLFRTTYKK